MPLRTMNMEARYEVWLHNLPDTAAGPADQALSRTFGIPVESAREIVHSLPRVVKRDADAGLAARIVAAMGITITEKHQARGKCSADKTE